MIYRDILEGHHTVHGRGCSKGIERSNFYKDYEYNANENGSTKVLVRVVRLRLSAFHLQHLEQGPAESILLSLPNSS